MKSSILVAFFCIALLAGANQPASFSGGHRSPEIPELPSPSGPFGIGRVGFDWTDPSRRDEFDSSRHRELMVYVWYPTARPPKAIGQYLPGAAQMDAKTDIKKFMSGEFGDAWTSIVSGAISSHAVEDAPIAHRHKPFPLVTFSHGIGGSGFGYTVLIEDLVSHGYVVASIEHTYTAGAVWFPDGRIVAQQNASPPTGLSEPERMQWMMKGVSKGVNDGAADVRFVIERLSQINREKEFGLAGAIDLTRVAAMGHSGGAEFAARACQQDSRIKACVDLDGAMVPVAALPLYDDDSQMRQPLLFLEAYHPANQMGGPPEAMANYEKTKQQQFQKLRPGSYGVVLHSPGIGHPSFSDVPLLFHGQDGYPEPQVALHNLRLITSLIRAFLDTTILGEKQPPFDGHTHSVAEAVVTVYGH
jgi:hypothetical protein